MRLTDKTVKAAQPTERPRKMFDGGGLFIEITPKGSKRWRLKYYFGEQEKSISYGTYPTVSLKQARKHRAEARHMLASGIDPRAARVATKNKGTPRNSFEAVAREWFETKIKPLSPAYSERLIRQLENNVFPYVGKRPVTEITAMEMLDVLRRIQKRGAIETAHRTLRNCTKVFTYATITGRPNQAPTFGLNEALPPSKPTHFAAVTDPTEFGQRLQAMDGYSGTLVVECALKLTPLVFVRPGELRKARWADIDLEAAEWRFEVTKTKTQHIVPLSKQAIDILNEIQPLTGQGKYVFPNPRAPKGDRPMSENAINMALRNLGIKKETMSAHGFRASARTILDEVLEWPVDCIEHQLAHAVKDANGRAYNRTSHLDKRKQMMQGWADYLDALKKP